MLHILKRPEHLFQIDFFHVRAQCTIADGIEFLFRVFVAQAIEQAHFSGHNKLGGIRLFRKGAHLAGREQLIRQIPNTLRAFRVGHYNSIRMVFLLAENIDIADAGMRRAKTVPDNHFTAQFLLHIVPQVRIRYKNNFLIRRNRADNLHGIRGGAAQIALRFHRSRAVYIADDHRTGVLRLFRAKLFGGNHIRHRTTGKLVRKQDGLFRAQNGGGFRHKVDAAENDYLFIQLGRLAAEFQRIARKVGNGLHFIRLVVVRNDNCAALALELLYTFFD